MQRPLSRQNTSVVKSQVELSKIDSDTSPVSLLNFTIWRQVNCFALNSCL